MADHATAATLLAKTHLFMNLGTDGCRDIAREMRSAHFAAGELLFSRGDPGNEIYLVIDGRVRLSMLTPEGREVSFAQAGPGALFGEIAALDGGLRTADATAVSKVEAMLLPRSALRRHVEKSPAIASGAIHFLCDRLRDAAEQLEAIALHPVEMRLARFLLSSARQRRGTGRETEVTLDLGMSQSDLALFLGASRPKVNVALSGLEDMGCVERKGHLIMVDIAELERMTGAE